MESTSDGSRLRTHPPLHGSSEIQPQCFSMFQPHSTVFAFLDPTCLSAMAGTAADWEENLMFECLNIFVCHEVAISRKIMINSILGCTIFRQT